jgi:transcriptional regulator NrdR family protein
MNCPICGGKTKTIDVRHVGYTTRRRRECVECSTRFTTKETIKLSSFISITHYTTKEASGEV